MRLITRGDLPQHGVAVHHSVYHRGGTIRQWSDPQLWCILAFGLTGIAGFIYEERLAWEPIIPLSLFRDRSFLLCSLIGFIIGMSLFGSVTFLPLYLQVVKTPRRRRPVCSSSP